jgi:NitT/TauT family transport system ATP-binding protein
LDTLIEVVGLKKDYLTGRNTTGAIDGISFSVKQDEVLCIVGPSGCGKTTLLKCMAGLLPPTAGYVTLRGGKVEHPLPEVAVVFQDYSRSLMPWLTVRKNVALPIRRKVDRRESIRIVNEALAAVGLSDFADYHPWQLSGGMQQRVAIARAVAYRPKVFLMDEPFASVDAQTRGELEDLVLKVGHDFGVTIVLVTHDIDESVYMADRVVVLTKGPSVVQEILSVPLERPRDQLNTKSDSQFVDRRAHVMRAITQVNKPLAVTALKDNQQVDHLVAAVAPRSQRALTASETEFLEAKSE